MVRVFALMAALMLLCSSVSLADPAKDGQTVVGAVWHWVITNKDGKELNGDFRVKDGNIYVGTDKIGTTRGVDTDEVVMTFGGYEDLNGRARLTKTMVKPAAFRGTLHRNDGTEWQMRVSVRNR